MAKFDVIIIGAGTAGLCAGALLATEGKKVLVCDKLQWLGGRGMAVPDEGYTLNLGSHLMEDTGSSITAILAHAGKEFPHGPVSTDLPVWDNETRRWASIRERTTDRSALKEVIRRLLDTPWEEFDKWDDRNLGEWLDENTTDQGVKDLFEYITLLECMTENWWDHSASDNLWARKLHWQETRKAGYSYWPHNGWEAMYQDLADCITSAGGEVRMRTPVLRVIVENREVKGVALQRQPHILPNELFEEEIIEAPCVISTLPVWHVLQVVPEHVLPEWYTQQIRYLAQDRWRVSWIGLYFATPEPTPLIDRLELASWKAGPVTGRTGFFFEQSAYDPTSAPDGRALYVSGCIIPGSKGRDKVFLEKTLHDYEEELGMIFPSFKDQVFRRRHLCFDPSYGVIQMPGLVGKFRPHWRAPNVDGLYFASETFRCRGVGVDRAARAAVPVVEDIIGKRLPGFGESYSWR